MKKLFTLIAGLILLISLNADAGHFIQKFTTEVGEAMCAACPDAAAGGDLLCEDFEGFETKCGWAWSAGSNVDNTPTGTWSCNETNAQNAEVIFDGNNEAVNHPVGNSSSPVYGVFYFKVTAESVPNNNNTILVYVQSNLGKAIFYLYLEQDGSGNLYFNIKNRNDSNTYTEKTVGSSYYYNVGEEVRVRFIHNATAGSGTATYYVRIEGKGEETVAFNEDETDDNEHWNFTYFGYPSIEIAYTAEYDFYRLDNDTMPTACSGDSY